jgi:hypothetical protein
MWIRETLALWALLCGGILGAIIVEPARAAVRVTVARARSNRRR